MSEPRYTGKGDFVWLDGKPLLEAMGRNPEESTRIAVREAAKLEAHGKLVAALQAYVDNTSQACSCHPGFSVRNLIDPACEYHEFKDELEGALDALELAKKAGA